MRSRTRTRASVVILMSPPGRRFIKVRERTFAESHLIIVCGHYEGMDHRVIEHLVDEEISIGDYVLTNGAIAAVVLVDAIVRLIPGVLGDDQSAVDDSFRAGITGGAAIHAPGRVSWLEGPEVLLAGNHGEIAAWRKDAKRGGEQNRIGPIF